MKHLSPVKRISTVFVSGLFLASVTLAGCTADMIAGPETAPGSVGTSATTVDTHNQDAPHNEHDGPSRALKNGESSTTYGADHNL